MLNSFGFTTEMAASGEEAIERLHNTPSDQSFDIVIVDWFMPGMDGIETIQYFEGYDASYQESSHGSAFGELDTGEESYSDEEKQMKKARFVFKEKQELKFISGVQNPTWTNNKLTFDYIGPVNELIQWMNQLDLQDAVLEEPDLETIFMNYYQ